MSKSVTATRNLAPLRALQAQLVVARKSFVKVGLLGTKDAQRPPVAGKVNDNPTLGGIQELGSASLRIPARSFLKTPLMDQMPAAIAAVSPDAWRNALLNKGVLHTLQILGVLGENVVQGGFRTGGYGKWDALAPFTIRKKTQRKKSLAILIEDGIMRKAIHSAVVKK